MTTQVAFSLSLLMVSLDHLLPSRKLPEPNDRTPKFAQIKSSIIEVGLIEPLSITRLSQPSENYLLVDGHIRLAVLRSLGYIEAPCLIALEDEGFTYNNRVNRLSTIQEHLMIKRAVERGVSPERIAKVLCVDARSIALKATLLEGICAEATSLLKDKQFTIKIARILRNMKPTRQVECVELMISTNNFTAPYVRAMLLATPAELLLDGKKSSVVTGVQPRQVAQIEREMTNVHARYKLVEESFGQNVMDLVLARGYVAKLLANSAVNQYLAERKPEIRAELERTTLATSID